jgi:hypothetical protein
MTTDTTTRDKFASKLAASIATGGLTHEQIAAQLGYSNPDFISLLINGTLRLPLVNVAPLARALGLDPDELTRGWWEAYCPGVSASARQLSPAAAGNLGGQRQ